VKYKQQCVFAISRKLITTSLDYQHSLRIKIMESRLTLWRVLRNGFRHVRRNPIICKSQL